MVLFLCLKSDIEHFAQSSQVPRGLGHLYTGVFTTLGSFFPRPGENERSGK